MRACSESTVHELKHLKVCLSANSEKTLVPCELSRVPSLRGGGSPSTDAALRRTLLLSNREPAELEDTYFRWLTRTDERLRELFDAYDTHAAVGGAMR